MHIEKKPDGTVVIVFNVETTPRHVIETKIDQLYGRAEYSQRVDNKTGPLGNFLRVTTR